MSQLEIEKGIALTEYRKAKAALGKKPDPDAAKILDETHRIAMDYLERINDPNYVSPTIFDIASYLEAHPEEAELDDQDLLALESLPETTRNRLKHLLKVA